MPSYIDSAFTVRKPAWWDKRREHVHDRPPRDWTEARQWAGLEWEPIERPLLVPAQGGRYEITDRQPQVDPPHPDLAANVAHLGGDGYARLGGADVVPGSKAICRSDTGTLLGVVGNDYPVIGHDHMGRIVEAMLERDDVVYETAGAIRGGKQVWALAHVDHPYEVTGYDTPIVPYLALLTDHTGGGALKAIRTTVTIVCYNTWRAAERDADTSGQAFRFPHRGTTETIDDRIDEARAAVLGARRDTERWVVRAEKLALLPMDEGREERFLERLCLPDDPTAHTDRVIANCELAMSEIRDLITGPTVQGAGIRGTALGCVAAAGEYYDHIRPYRTTETLFRRTMIAPQPRKQAAERIAVEEAGWDPTMFEAKVGVALESASLTAVT